MLIVHHSNLKSHFFLLYLPYYNMLYKFTAWLNTNTSRLVIETIYTLCVEKGCTTVEHNITHFFRLRISILMYESVKITLTWKYVSVNFLTGTKRKLNENIIIQLQGDLFPLRKNIIAMLGTSWALAYPVEYF